jgi:hypothetical protein
VGERFRTRTQVKKNLGVRVAEGAVTRISELYGAAAVAPQKNVALFFHKQNYKRRS